MKPSSTISHRDFNTLQEAEKPDHDEGRSSASIGKTLNLEKINTDHQRGYEEHGPGIDHKIPQADETPSEPNLWWSRVRHTMREPFSEFFGVFILILFGDGYIIHHFINSGISVDLVAE